MLTKLTLGEKLKDLRLEKGYKSTEQLAGVVNIPKTTLNDYENDEKNQDVGYANLITLAKFYEVSMDWLLGLSDVDLHLNTEYIDLGLNDDVIDLLRERKINTRLLCDLILDPNFSDFMADIEIYIDGYLHENNRPEHTLAGYTHPAETQAQCTGRRHQYAYHAFRAV